MFYLDYETNFLKKNDCERKENNLNENGSMLDITNEIYNYNYLFSKKNRSVIHYSILNIIYN